MNNNNLNTAEHIALREQFRDEAFSVVKDVIPSNSIEFIIKNEKNHCTLAMCEKPYTISSNKIKINDILTKNRNDDQITNEKTNDSFVEKVFQIVK